MKTYEKLLLEWEELDGGLRCLFGCQDCLIQRVQIPPHREGFEVCVQGCGGLTKYAVFYRLEDAKAYAEWLWEAAVPLGYREVREVPPWSTQTDSTNVSKELFGTPYWTASWT